jgi:hypothetical protein
MASKLDAFRDEVLNKTRPDKDIAREAGVTLGAIRAFRKRNAKGTKPTLVKAVPAPTKAEAKPAAKAKAKKPKAKTAAKKRVKVELPEGVDKQCPACGKEATGDDQIQDLFGFRNVKTKVTEDHPEGRKKIPQSQCKECRRKSVKKSKKKADQPVAVAAK